MLGLKQAGNALNDQTQCVSKLPRGTNVTMTPNGSSVPSFERISYAKAETLYHSRSRDACAMAHLKALLPILPNSF